MDCMSYYYFEVNVSYYIDECNLNNKYCDNIFGYEVNEVRKGVVKSIEEGFSLTCVIDNIKRDIIKELKCNCDINHSSINMALNNVISITSFDFEKIKCKKEQYGICSILDCSKYYC
ncbi:MAG TPA: hypothetical protein VLM81_00685 [Peptostreptococcaceae bacterium]|nr:hypothetical protein [Peptostreptococcaceae bacterium]